MLSHVLHVKVHHQAASPSCKTAALQVFHADVMYILLSADKKRVHSATCRQEKQAPNRAALERRVLDP